MESLIDIDTKPCPVTGRSETFTDACKAIPPAAIVPGPVGANPVLNLDAVPGGLPNPPRLPGRDVPGGNPFDVPGGPELDVKPDLLFGLI